jgi:hypothetical protein
VQDTLGFMYRGADSHRVEQVKVDACRRPDFVTVRAGQRK